MTDCICTKGGACDCGLCSMPDLSYQGRNADVPQAPWLGYVMRLVICCWTAIFAYAVGIWFGGLWFVGGSILGAGCVFAATCWALGQVAGDE